jgi:4a-hydroxytetrahydrobiopterin dehydratase
MKNMALAYEACIPCRLGGLTLPAEVARELAADVPKWELSEKRLKREFQFGDFHEAMRFVNRVAELANEQDHHPDIYIFYNRVLLTLSTHKIGGLSRNDFILAAQIDFLE